MVNTLFNRKLDPEKLKKLNKYIVQDKFHEKMEKIGKLNLSITQSPIQGGIGIIGTQSFNDGKIKVIDGITKIHLNAKNGLKFSKNVLFTSYDESKLSFNALEGVANIISHSLLAVAKDQYFPISMLTVNFYTRSVILSKDSDMIHYSENPESDSNRDYAIDRNDFIQEHILDDSILLVDGPIIGGNLSAYSINLIKQLHKKNVIPFFIVKNSDSNLVTSNVDILKDQYNSDLHWAYDFLSPGDRTNFFQYIDRVNPNNTKIFCYIKPFDKTSPQRVELHPETFSIYRDYINDILDLIYYLVLVQGDAKNPQVRTIAIAERYAREIIRTVNTRKAFRYSSLIPTMNQKRFGV